jgi:glutaredoxin
VFEPRIRIVLSILAFTFHAAPCVASDLGDVLRGAREVNRTTRETKALYKEVQSIAVPVIAQRHDTLTTDKERVIFYSASWCGYCNQARKYMRSRQVAFVEYDIDSSPRGYADYRALNGTGVPILLLGDQRLNGWGATRFDQMYERFKSAAAQAGASDAASGVGHRMPKTSSSGMDVGSVLVAKISNVAMYSSTAQSAVVARLAKGEEVVVLQLPEDDLIKVQSATGVGYVDRRLVSK